MNRIDSLLDFGPIPPFLHRRLFQWLLVFLFLSVPSYADDPRKEWVRLSYTEFCATVPKPPKIDQEIHDFMSHAPGLAQLGEWAEYVAFLRKEKCDDS